MVALEVHLVVATDGQLQHLGKRVHDRHADTVQSARDFVRVVVELPAGMQDGHDDLGSGAALFRVQVHRYSTAVVGDGYDVVAFNRDLDVGAVSGERFINGVVHHFEDHVVEAGTVVGIANIHPGPFANGIKAAEYLDAGGIVTCTHGLGVPFKIIIIPLTPRPFVPRETRIRLLLGGASRGS